MKDLFSDILQDLSSLEDFKDASEDVRLKNSQILRSAFAAVCDRLQVLKSEGRVCPKALCSACLLGFPCRYDGKVKTDEELQKLFMAGELIPVCPEVQGGLPTPRVPAGVTSCGQDVLDKKGQVINRLGNDVSESFVLGAELALETAERFGVSRAVLKQHSPSCGCGSTGGSQGFRLAADGTACALLKRNGIYAEPAGL